MARSSVPARPSLVRARSSDRTDLTPGYEEFPPRPQRVLPYTTKCGPPRLGDPMRRDGPLLSTGFRREAAAGQLHTAGRRVGNRLDVRQAAVADIAGQRSIEA